MVILLVGFLWSRGQIYVAVEIGKQATNVSHGVGQMGRELSQTSWQDRFEMRFSLSPGSWPKLLGPINLPFNGSLMASNTNCCQNAQRASVHIYLHKCILIGIYETSKPDPIAFALQVLASDNSHFIQRCVLVWVCHAPFAPCRTACGLEYQKAGNFSRWLPGEFSMQNNSSARNERPASDKTRKATKLLVTNNFWRFLYGKLAAAIKCQKHVSVWPCICSVCVINKNPECHANGTTGVVWSPPAPTDFSLFPTTRRLALERYIQRKTQCLSK